MKKTAIASLLTGLLASNAFAADVTVPFIRKAIPPEGLNIAYNTNGTEKVVCIMENPFRGYLATIENGIEKYTGFGFPNNISSEFYFSSEGSNEPDRNSPVPQFHVDKKSYIKIVGYYIKSDAYASCFYIPETASK